MTRIPNISSRKQKQMIAYAEKMKKQGKTETQAMYATANKFKITLLDERQIPINTTRNKT